jgi:anhydro-N-acetylmuramic acid kinase
MDMATQKLFGESFERDGAIASQGKPDLDLISKWLEQEFFVTAPPKSTGRELFSPDYLEACLAECQNLNNYDILATLTEFTARAIAKSYRDFLPVFPDEVLIGMSGDSKEAIAFALLGYLRLKERAGNLPSVTGALRSVLLGKIYQ